MYLTMYDHQWCNLPISFVETGYHLIEDLIADMRNL